MTCFTHWRPKWTVFGCACPSSEVQISLSWFWMFLAAQGQFWLSHEEASPRTVLSATVFEGVFFLLPVPRGQLQRTITSWTLTLTDYIAKPGTRNCRYPRHTVTKSQHFYVGIANLVNWGHWPWIKMIKMCRYKRWFCAYVLGLPKASVSWPYGL